MSRRIFPVPPGAIKSMKELRLLYNSGIRHLYLFLDHKRTVYPVNIAVNCHANNEFEVTSVDNQIFWRIEQCFFYNWDDHVFENYWHAYAFKRKYDKYLADRAEAEKT